VSARQRFDPVAIAQALIRCESVTPAEAGALGTIAALLRPAGFVIERPVFEEPGSAAVENLYARIGTGSPAFVFAGHVDVVPPGDAALWSRPPFSGDLADGRLFGRGAADMKGGVAAALAATLQHLDVHGAPSAGSIAFLITGDEEGPAVNGTVKLLDWMRQRGEPIDHCVLGEPTSRERLGDTIKIGRRGSLTGRLRVIGRQGHVAYPHLAENPIPALAALVTALSDTPIDHGNAHFDPSTLAFTTIDVGNPATNVIPAAAKAGVHVRFNSDWTHETLAEALRARCEAASAGRFRYELVFDPSNSDAFLTAPGPFVALIGDAIEAETGIRPALSTSGGTSDARFIKNHGEVIEFGLVGQTMHQIDEHISVADLEGLTRIYRGILERYFSAPSSVARD